MLRNYHFTILLLVLLSGCAGTPNYDSYGADGTLTPQNVSARPQQAAGKQVLWGGVIMKTLNLKDRTQIEVLAYPLDSDSRPRTGEIALGRFITEKEGFLEPTDYASNRRITVVGTLAGALPGQVGESDYNFPLVNAGQLTLWPESRGNVGDNVRFGVGIGVGGGGSWGGVGVGF